MPGRASVGGGGPLDPLPPQEPAPLGCCSVMGFKLTVGLSPPHQAGPRERQHPGDSVRGLGPATVIKREGRGS